MSFRRTNDIEALLEWLGSLQITEETLDNYVWSDIEMLEVLALAAINKNIQTVTPKNIISDLEWFDGD